MTFPVLASNGPSGYNLSRSLRFRSSASASLSRTPASATNRQIWTWSAWVKLAPVSVQAMIFNAGLDGNNRTQITYETGGTLGVAQVASGSVTLNLATASVYRDYAAWYHIVVACDSTQATSSNRVKIYVNGTQVTAFTTATYFAQNANTYVNSNIVHNYGVYIAGSTNYYDGYIADTYLIDGQALTPSSFGSTNTITGVWQPAQYTGTYGTNGYYLPFTDNSALTTSSNVGLGKDFSGNGNYWTTNNISITAGTTYDSMTDVPTLTSATAANYCVGNPLSVGSNTSLTNANLSGTLTGSGGWAGTICGLTSGKWYYETTMTANSGNSAWVGFLSDVYTKNDNAWSYSTQTALYANDGRNGNNASYGATWTTNDVIGIALDLSTSSGSITFYKNGVSQGVMFSSLTTSAVWRPLISGGGTGTTIAMNFGQRPFAYTPPTGYVALNTYNLPDSTIVKGNTVMDATLYTGNSSTQTVTNAGAFEPDFVWIKNRSIASQHVLTDSVRGVDKQLFSSLTNAEQTSATGITSFNSNGFSLGSNVGPTGDTNSSPNSFVAWQWLESASAGFDIVTFTGNGGSQTFAHGLGVAPGLMICKSLNNAQDWYVYHRSIGGTGALLLNSTVGTQTSVNYWANVTPGSGTFSVGPNFSNGYTYINFLFAPIAGYSAFGSYTGNGSSDGPMVYTGFKPRFLLIKKTATGGGDRGWLMEDTARSPYNAAELFLYANTSDAESNNQQIDFLSNGFKIRNNGLVVNDSGVTMIYAAFAENPFKNALAR